MQRRLIHWSASAEGEFGCTGGMVHELGHALGLPDSASTDGTPTSADFYDYPNTHFDQSQKNQILNGPYGSFLS
ncbi:hypothetical protein [Streptomyces sp. LUP30]|uniref:hypothetical protein n=1 Tax=Streptomyces sp. LUP30 TaxID=1890285 RepID=UPI00099FA779|nr:hypothetical protein [Streptomyces sp. LUP30]